VTISEAQVKRFTAPTMTRALELVREEMGPEAVILSSQKVKGGVEIVISSEPDLATRGLPERRAFGRNFDTDVDSALDSDMSWQSQAGIERAAAEYSGQVENNGRVENNAASNNQDSGLADAIERARERMFEAKRQSLESKETHANRSRVRGESQNNEGKVQNTGRVEPSLGQAKLNAEYSQRIASDSKSQIENEKKLETMRGELADLRMLLEEQVWSKKEPLSKQVESRPLTENLATLTMHLSRLGITQPLVETLCESVGKGSRISEAWQNSLAHLAKKINIASNIDTDAGGVFAFIGPTGVGKTTTLAKLAARYSVEHGPGKVALVSMDTHRVGAVEQLKALGRILDVPVRTVNAASSLMTTLASLRHFPLVLIDTAGFRHGDAKLKAQIAQLDENPSVKRLLVLSSLSQLQTLKASIHAYQPRQNIDACVLSKLDEATSLGESLSAVIEHELPVAYVTDGQEIPRDVHQANQHNLVASAVSIAKQAAQVESASI